MRPAIVTLVALSLWLSAGGGCGGKPEQATAAAAKVSAATTPAVAASTVQPAGPKQKTCEDCRNLLCRTFVERDVVAGCLERVDVESGVTTDPKFIEDCTRAVRCAFEHDCAYDRFKGPAGCYCGSRSLDECAKLGPAPDAACVEEWKAATRSQKHEEIIQRFSVSAYPSGWANNLLLCDRDRCGWGGQYGCCTPLSKPVP